MKAVITMKLIRPTRLNRTIIKKTITARKDYIVGLVNGFIHERANRMNFIHVEEFDVIILNAHGKAIEQWKYNPTYR